jgi:rubrerythrin
METAENEKEHAKVFFKHLEGGEVEITAMYPAGVIGDTKSNLEAAAAGENLEWTTLYQDFAQVAKDEGFPEVARSFDQIAKVERFHEARYRKLIANVAGGEVFKKKQVVKWHCINCGYVHEGEEAPKICPPACIPSPTTKSWRRTFECRMPIPFSRERPRSIHSRLAGREALGLPTRNTGTLPYFFPCPNWKYRDTSPIFLFSVQR